MERREWMIGLVVIVVVTAALVYYYSNHFGNKKDPSTNVAASISSPGEIKIVQLWELPEELVEISSNAFIDSNRMALIQDNHGIIYVYNLTTKTVDSRIEFAGDADYEALSVVGNTFYVLRSDGFLYEVITEGNNKPVVKTYDLPLTEVQDTEPMFYDEKNNRLLVGVKEKDLTEKETKGVYAFDLATKQFNEDAVFQIDGDASNAGEEGKKRKGRRSKIKPSEIAIHPQTGEVYVLNGPESQLLIADASGSIKSMIQLDTKIFPQPEGMCFSSSGELYISSEGGKKGKGVIAKVKI